MDQDLVVRAQNGDREAYEALARASARRLYLAAHRIVRDADRADDAVQQTLVAMWRELPSLRDPDRFDWSPDGSRILFVQPDGAMTTVAMDGSGVAPALATGLGRGVHPRYRPVP